MADVVVIGPATSKNFEVVETADGCDYLIGHGERAPVMAKPHQVPLVSDGDQAAGYVWGASPGGLAMAMAARESDPRLVAVAHPSLEGGSDQTVRFPKPLGRLSAADSTLGGRRLARARSTQFAACLVEGGSRSVSIVDDGAFLAGIALAAGVACVETGGAVWENPLPYLQAAVLMGLVMAEDV